MKNTPFSRLLIFIAAVVLFGALVVTVHKGQASGTTSTIAEVDSDGNVGVGTSVAVNGAGEIVIAYFDADNLALKVAVCEDKNCWNPDIETVDDNGDVGTSPRIAITNDDRPVISYFDDANGDLKLAVCNDPYCTSANIEVVDGGGTTGLTNALTLDDAGRPLISYYDVTNQRLKLAICNNLNCTSPNLVDIDNAGNPGIFSSIAVNDNGRPVIAYYEADNADLKIALCNDAICSAPTIKTLDAVNNAGSFASLEIIAGRIFVTYLRTNGGGVDVKVARCDDASCNSVSVLHLIDMQAALYASSVMNDQGELFISYWDATQGDLIVSACIVNQVTGCKEATHSRVDRFFITGLYPDITLDQEGTPIISYYDLEEEALNMASCPLCRVPTRNNVGPAAAQDSITLALTDIGYPIMTYQDAGDNNFYLVFCQDTVCDNFEKTSIGTNLHINPSMQLQENGRPALAYYHTATNELKYTVCNNDDCSDKTTNVIAFDGYDPSLRFNSDGLPVIAFYDAGGDNLNLARCNDIECSFPIKTLVDDSAKVGRHTSMALTPEDYPVISYYDETNDTIKFAVCDDPGCSNPLIGNAQPTDGPYNALALSDDGYFYIAYYDNGNQNLRLLRCQLACAGHSIGVVDNTAANVGWDISMVMSQDGRPIISYYDAENGALRMATCIEITCNQETVSVIDTMNGTNGRFTAMTLNGRGQPVIAHTNMSMPSARIVVYDTEPTFYQVYAPAVMGQ